MVAIVDFISLSAALPAQPEQDGVYVLFKLLFFFIFNDSLFFIKPGSGSNECLIDCVVHLKQLLCCNFCRLFMLYLESSIYGIKWKMSHMLREIRVSAFLKYVFVFCDPNTRFLPS